MSEYLTVLAYVSIWMVLYHLFIIPRTAQQAFEVWQQRLEDERNLIVDITEPVIEVIDDLLTSKFQFFFWFSFSIRTKSKRAKPIIKNG